MSSSIISPDDMEYIVETWEQARRVDAKVSVWSIVDVFFDDDGLPCQPTQEVYHAGTTFHLTNLIKIVDRVINRSPADDWFLDISYC